MTAETRHASSLRIDLNGHSLDLCPERALFDPTSGALLVADAHFGKAATFRAHGIPVPGGTTSDNLLRLDRAIARHAPQRLVFLGDLLHAKPAQASAIADALAAWRARHTHIDMVLIRGNHDKHAGSPAPRIGLREADEPWALGPWLLCHHPTPIDDAYVLAGHEHPTLLLTSPTDRARLPCFVFGQRLGILPAFGDFTGGHPVRRAEDRRLFVVADDRVLPV